MTIHLLKKSLVFAVLWIGLTNLSGCADIPKTEFKTPLEYPKDAKPAPLMFTGIKTRIPPGTEMGYMRPNCNFRKKVIGRSTFRHLPQQDIEDSFAEMMEMQGYDIVNQLSMILDEEIKDEYNRAEYRIGAKLINAMADICYTDATSNILVRTIFPDIQGVSGHLSVEIEWGIYDVLHRTMVYKTTTKGYTDQAWGNIDGVDYLFNEAFSMAAHNLGTDKNFHDLIFYGTKPSNEWKKGAKTFNKDRPRKYDAQSTLTLKNPPLQKTPSEKHIRKAAENAVMVQAGTGHGSGFFINKEGYIITNSHVVGDALRVRIVTAHKEEKLIAEVLRSNKMRDVALLRLENLPETLKITPAPIKREWPKVSEEIYAVGAPARFWMQDTLTKGIVSAYRKFKHQSLVLNYIQGDVTITNGSSGGPLLDASGNIIGITVKNAYRKTGESDNGLNLFIPIDEALNYLDIELMEHSSAQ